MEHLKQADRELKLIVRQLGQGQSPGRCTNCRCGCGGGGARKTGGAANGGCICACMGCGGAWKPLGGMWYEFIPYSRDRTAASTPAAL